jgi:hypothetical protein
MRDSFIDFLTTNSTLSAETYERLRSMLRGAPEPIGSIAFKYGIITSGDIDMILDEQRKNHRRFGEIAIEMGIFTKPQLKSLLKVQEMRAAVETAEALALSGVRPTEEIMAHLGEFLCQAREPQTI